MADAWMIAMPHEAVIVSLVVPGDPIAHQRPRFGRGGSVYTPDASRTFKHKLMLLIRQATSLRDAPGTFGVQARFYRSNRQRIDGDNLLKSVLDAGTQAGIWRDDSQVRELAARIWLGQPSARVEFVIYRIDDPSPNQCCAGCGVELKAGNLKRRFCSYECATRSKQTTLTCAKCQAAFTLPRSCTRGNPGYPRKYCSRACSIAAHQEKARIKGKESDTWVCRLCGGRVSRKEYQVCRGCSMTTRSDPTGSYWTSRHTLDGKPLAVKRSCPTEPVPYTGIARIPPPMPPWESPA